MDQQTQEPSIPSTPPSKSNNMPMIAIVILIVIVGAGGFFLLNTKNNTQQTRTVESAQITKAPIEAMKAEAAASPSAGSTAQTTKEFTIIGANFSFSPNTLTVNKGDTVKVTFQNNDGFHDWNLDEFNVHTKKIPAGQSDTVTFIADKTGSFEYYCSVGNHRAMGMKGTLTVQ